MKGCFLWGEGSDGMAYPTDPDQLKNECVSWASDINALSPWTPGTFLPDTPAERCWTSGQAQKKAQLILTGPCKSSMDLAWQFISKKSLLEWGSLLASRQWNGRGQLGRMWMSPAGNIYSATRLPTPSKAWDDLLPLVLGYCLVKSFAQINIKMALKWPNDLMMDNKKVGGILIERKEDMVVAGVGINLISSPEKTQLRNHMLIEAASLRDFGYEFTPFCLWQNLVGRCRDIFRQILRTQTPAQFILDAHAHLAFKDTGVRVIDRENKTWDATPIGLAENGGLKLLKNNEITIIQTGSICPLIQ
ncbi:MAG: biotin--[acetyl-CoA-carboxylase] ligase [Proteobacteria bacterium]|nr:biotin--[acetyl-CoA-carboxylase] ligase [Pseudomonadota bacterium]